MRYNTHINSVPCFGTPRRETRLVRFTNSDFYAKEKNTSDVHLTVGLPPMLRIDGELCTHGDVPLTEQDVQDAAQQLAMSISCTS